MSLTDTVKGQNGAPDTTKAYLYGYDMHENVSLLISEVGKIRASYGYTTFGDSDDDLTAELKPEAPDTTTSGTDLTVKQSPLNPYRYTGKRLDSGSGQLDMGARRYGPGHRPLPPRGRLQRRARRSCAQQRSAVQQPLHARRRQPDQLRGDRRPRPGLRVGHRGPRFRARDGAGNAPYGLPRPTSGATYRGALARFHARRQAPQYADPPSPRPVWKYRNCPQDVCPRHDISDGSAKRFAQDIFGDDLGEIAINLTPFGKGAQLLKGLYTGGKAAYRGARALNRGRHGAEDATKETARLRARADELHGALDPRAQRGRTSAVLSTREGRDVLAGGVRDLDLTQRALARGDDLLGRLPGAHAVETALGTAARAGLTPRAIETTTNISPACQALLKESGATITGPRSAWWFR
jgi:hypothetical protein